MKGYFAYIRVSTQKQGEMGSSLREQRDAISVYARRSNIEVERWFEEVETAAKQGRAQFTTMMRALRSQKARGVIFHKIDRGARNLKDWNAIQELIESGVDVRFAHESLDMQTRGGRLTADMLAVIASDYIRNLREEIRKGILGRLKQGIYPLPSFMTRSERHLSSKPLSCMPRAIMASMPWWQRWRSEACVRSLAERSEFPTCPTFFAASSTRASSK
jgi:site-specific DNA recombinase